MRRAAIGNRDTGISDPSDPAKPSDAALRNLVGYNMKRAFSAIQADLAQLLSELDLRVLTYSALTVIVDNPGLSQAQLADVLAIERSNVVVIVDELEQRELIIREKVAGDRRAYSLKSTLKGQRLQERALKADLAHEHRIFEDFTPHEVERLIEALRRIESVATRVGR